MAEKILLTGATGFIGRNLLPRLLEAGHQVRATSRRPPQQVGLPPHENLEIVQADLVSGRGLSEALEGIDAAFYLVHSMEGGVGDDKEFVERDKKAARHFARGATDAGVEQIIYLSGLKPPDNASAHLESRRQVERVLAEGQTPLTVLRAGFIIGDGSAGMTMLAALTDTLDTLMVIPEFRNLTQPADVDDVVESMLCCMDHRDETAGHTYEVGSMEKVSYRDLIEMYAAYAGKPLELVDVPWAPRSFGAAFISAISDLPYALVRALSEGLTTDLLVENEALYELCDLPRTSPEEAIRKSLSSGGMNRRGRGERRVSLG